jgi:hypothetical protein
MRPFPPKAPTASLPPSIATGWSEPVPGRAFLPAVVQRLFTAHCYANDPSSDTEKDLAHRACPVGLDSGLGSLRFGLGARGMGGDSLGQTLLHLRP